LIDWLIDCTMTTTTIYRKHKNYRSRR
jgi:hypothetical protein